MEDDNRICIMGMGYVGLTLAVAMARAGYRVHGVEIDDTKLDLMKKGKPHFFETGLESTMKTVGNNLSFSKNIPKDPYPVYIITVGTPISKDTKIPRFDMVENVTKDISQVCDQKSIVILRSTVAVGTTRNVVVPILKQKIKSPQVAFCSERTLEGKALEEIVTLPQVVGAIDERSLKRAANLFHTLTPTIVEVSSLETAEIIKLLDNVFRDTQFALANEVAEMCEVIGIDGYETIRAANLGYDRTNIALPGYVAGPCLEKDPHILAYSLKKYNYEPKIIMSARRLHENLQARIAERVLDWTVKNKLDPKKIKVTLLGLAFKGIPETDDLRGAPSLLMIDELRRRGFTNLYGHDYLVPENEISKLQIQPVDIKEAFHDTNVVIFMNNHPAYKKLNANDAVGKMPKKALFIDSWNMFDHGEITARSGVSYGSIGKR